MTNGNGVRDNGVIVVMKKNVKGNAITSAIGNQSPVFLCIIYKNIIIGKKKYTKAIKSINGNTNSGTNKNKP